MNGNELIGRMVRAKTAQGQEQAVGIAVAFTNLPTFTIEDSKGQKFSWVASLVEPLEFFHTCGSYTWIDGNYCCRCGGKLDGANA